MNCMKCGVQIPEQQVFCDHCLEGMAQDPIKPGTHIHLPKRQEAEDTGKKVPKKKRPASAEEQVAALRMKVLRLRLTAVVLAFAVCVVSGFLMLKIFETPEEPATGRNYTIDTSMND